MTRATARSSVWERQSPLADESQVIIDLDATLIGSHSEKELASPNYKRGFGFHPMMAFVDHGKGGTGEPVAALLRTGRAAANDAADQIAVLDAALAQLPEQHRKKVLVRGDSGSGVQPFVHHIHDLGLRYSVSVYGRQPVLDALAALTRKAWKKALDADGKPREGTRVAELTRRLPARCEDRTRNLKDTGVTNLPLQSFDKNQIWLELCCLASELIVWTQTLAFHDLPVRLWEPKRLRLRLLAVAGRIITTARRRILRLSKRWPWTDLIIGGHRRLTMIT